MVRIGSDGDDLDADDADERDRVARAPDVVRGGWRRTVSDVRAMARDREAAGYEAMQLFADDTTPLAPGSGGTDRWGLTYLIDDDAADAFRAFDARTAFDETAVYQRTTGGNVFVATECLDHDAAAVLFVAGVYRRRRAADLARAATERGRMWTHVRRLDGTVVGSVEHEAAEPFFPDADGVAAGDRDGDATGT
jgi:hypothetical protein